MIVPEHLLTLVWLGGGEQLACVGTAATAAVALPAVAGSTAVGSAAGSVGSTISSAVVAGGAGLLAAGDTIMAGFAAGVSTAGTFLAGHAGAAAKLCEWK